MAAVLYAALLSRANVYAVGRRGQRDVTKARNSGVEDVKAS